jgi:molybdate/tungstate transport system permease protein
MKNKILNIFEPGPVFLIFSITLLIIIVFPVLILFSFIDIPTFKTGIQDMEVLDSIKVTILSGIIATFLGLLSGLPLAWIMTEMDKKYRVIMEPLTEIPIVLPPIIAGVALLQSVSPASFAGAFLRSLNIEMINSIPGIILAMYFVGVPFIVKACLTGLESADKRYYKVAQCLGARPWTVFFKITVPSIYKPIINGCVLMFGRSMGIFGTVVLIASARPTIPVLVYNRFNAYGLKSAIVPAILLTLVSFAFFVIRQMLAKWLSR